MKSKPIQRGTGFRHLLLAAALGLSAASAQTAGNLGAPAATAAAKPAEIPAVPEPAELLVISESRMVPDDRIDAYAATLSASFSMRTRELDPFGHQQDPDAKPTIKEPARALNRIAPRQETPFSEIVRMIPVTAIMPGERSFLVGSRTVKVGEMFPLGFRGKSIRARATTVTARKISFENLDSGETASRTLDLLPPGMSMGAGGSISAPGMVPDSANAPIELDSPESSN